MEDDVLADITVGYMNVNPVCCLYGQETLSGIRGGFDLTKTTLWFMKILGNSKTSTCLQRFEPNILESFVSNHKC